MIEVEWDSRRIREVLRNLSTTLGDFSSPLMAIREVLVESTRQRFITKTAPDGSPWPDNAETTIDRKGRNDPLIFGGYLESQINGQIVDRHTLEIYSTLEYAAMQQFGGTKEEFPYLWGDIPERPFPGISLEDEAAILDIASAELEHAIK